MWTVEILDRDGKVVDTASAATREDARRWGRRFAGPGEVVRVFQFTEPPAESDLVPDLLGALLDSLTRAKAARR